MVNDELLMINLIMSLSYELSSTPYPVTIKLQFDYQLNIKILSSFCQDLSRKDRPAGETGRQVKDWLLSTIIILCL